MGLPKVYGFINSGGGDWLHTVGLAEDGTVLAGHVSSSVFWARHDIGPKFKHERYIEHYPDGYEFEFVEREDLDKHQAFQAALRLAEAKSKKMISIPPAEESP